MPEQQSFRKRLIKNLFDKFPEPIEKERKLVNKDKKVMKKLS